MKTIHITSATILLLLLTLNSQLSDAFAQGSLTPPGLPAPTMKSLDQIEPRTPISAVPFVITNPGSYYLVSNLDLTVNTNAITISANDVTLDLKGFTIATSVLRGSGTAILLNGGNTDISIANGHITGGNYPYFGCGINYAGSAPVNVSVVNVTVRECVSYGINLGTNTSTLVKDCLVQSIDGYGIAAGVVSLSGAYQCGLSAVIANQAMNSTGVSLNGDGVDASMANGCYGSAGGSGWGVYASNAANDCYGYVADGSGIAFSAGVFSLIASHCYGRSDGTGLGMFTEVATGCYCVSSGSNGLLATVATGCYCIGGGSGKGLITNIGNGCYANSENVTYKYNMP